MMSPCYSYLIALKNDYSWIVQPCLITYVLCRKKCEKYLKLFMIQLNVKGGGFYSPSYTFKMSLNSKPHQNENSGHHSTALYSSTAWHGKDSIFNSVGQSHNLPFCLFAHLKMQK